MTEIDFTNACDCHLDVGRCRCYASIYSGLFSCIDFAIFYTHQKNVYSLEPFIFTCV